MVEVSTSKQAIVSWGNSGCFCDKKMTFHAHDPLFMFSGQGSQKPGMGEDLFTLDPVQHAFACASEVLGYDLKELVLHGSASMLNDTRYAQPALCALSLGIARALMMHGVQPAAVLGFSLGQISALAAAGMLCDEDVFRLVKTRSELMAQCSKKHPGAMSALLKADETSARELCQRCAQGEVLLPANFNGGGQIVIAGSPSAVMRAEESWKASGKRVSRLATSGAFHSPLMNDAATEFASFIKTFHFSEPLIPLINNVDARPLRASCAREQLVKHLTSPVLFEQSIEALSVMGATSFVEVGVGGVLINLVKRINKNAERRCIQDRSSFEEAVAFFTKLKEPAV